MEKEIIKLFLTNNKLRFNQIEKPLKIRSNKLNYHLKKLIDKKIIEKEKGFYKLTESSEHLIPYVSEKNSVLPIILTYVGNNKKALLYLREKRPYKGLLSLPGGRMILGEDIRDSVKRILKEKGNLNASLKKINSISLEHVKNKNKTLYSFLLIFVTATTKDKTNLTEIEKNKSKIIPSDYKLIKEFRTQSIKISKIISRMH